MRGQSGIKSSGDLKRGVVGHTSVEEMDSPQLHAVVQIVSHFPPSLVFSLRVTSENRTFCSCHELAGSTCTSRYLMTNASEMLGQSNRCILDPLSRPHYERERPIRRGESQRLLLRRETDSSLGRGQLSTVQFSRSCLALTF